MGRIGRRMHVTAREHGLQSDLSMARARRLLPLAPILVLAGCSVAPLEEACAWMPPDRVHTGERIVATWNVHHAVGLDGLEDVGRMAQVLCALDADVVGLQEVDPAHLDQLAALAGYDHRVYGDHGVAALSRWPIHDDRLTRLGHAPGDWHERVALSFRTGACRLAVTHLAVTPHGRAAQAHRLVEHVLGQAPPGDECVLLLGDLNGEPWDPELRPLHAAGWHSIPTGPTFPADAPMTHIDHIWASPDVHHQDVAVVQTLFSDHRPVVSTVQQGSPMLARTPAQERHTAERHTSGR